MLLVQPARAFPDDGSNHEETGPSLAGRMPVADGHVRVGALFALSDGGATAYVSFPGQIGIAAVRARCTVNLSPGHVGADVLLVFESGDYARPIVIGVLRGQPNFAELGSAGVAQVQADGQRLTVSAKGELVLRCGQSQLALHADGRIELRAETIVSEAAGVNRVRGGSIQLN